MDATVKIAKNNSTFVIVPHLAFFVQDAESEETTVQALCMHISREYYTV